MAWTIDLLGEVLERKFTSGKWNVYLVTYSQGEFCGDFLDIDRDNLNFILFSS